MTKRHSWRFYSGAPLALAFCLVVGCTAKQPESAKPVAAFEVPLPSENDRNEFLSVLRAVAKTEGMHVDTESKSELESLAKAIPAAAMTMNAAVWRGANDDESIASAMDAHDHLGRVWIMFSKGEDPALSSRFQEDAMHEIKLRWPDTLSLPIMPTGAIPLTRDLVRTPNGYIVNPTEAYRYQLQGAQGRPQ